MDIDVKIGSRLRECRKEKQLGQKDIQAHIPELTITRLSNYEKGIRSLPIDMAIKIASVLDVSASYILTIDEKKEPEIKSDSERELLAYYRSVKDEFKADIMKYARNLFTLSK